MVLWLLDDASCLGFMSRANIIPQHACGRCVVLWVLLQIRRCWIYFVNKEASRVSLVDALVDTLKNCMGWLRTKNIATCSP